MLYNDALLLLIIAQSVNYSEVHPDWLNGHDKEVVYVATCALQYMAMVYYYYRYTCTHDIIYTL